MMSNTPDSALLIPRKMFRHTSWSRFALICVVLSFIGGIVFSIADGVISDAQMKAPHSDLLYMARTWVADLRFMSLQIIYAATILFIGAKFIEQRTVISVGFDKRDSGKMAVKGPDEKFYVWVGRKYPSRIEAENAVAALRSGIMQSEEKNFGEFGW
jgi:hypothetical protein